MGYDFGNVTIAMRVFSFWFLQTGPFDLPMLVSYKRIENGYVKTEDAVTNSAERYPLRIL